MVFECCFLDLFWDVNSVKSNGAIKGIPNQEISDLREILQKDLKHYARQSHQNAFELHEISFEESKDIGARLIVTLSFFAKEERNWQKTRKTIERWISSSFKEKKYDNLAIYFDGERYVTVLTNMIFQSYHN